MRRRSFLKAMSVAPLAAAVCDARARDDRLASQRIVKITGFVHRAPRPKFVGKNSHLDDHGDATSDRVLRLVTNEGVEGFGAGAISEEVARQIVGMPVDALWNDSLGSTGLLGRNDHALFDLVAKIRGVPAWRLIGDAGDEWVDSYDGSIYFNDLLPQHAEKGVGRLVAEAEQGLSRGFRAFKIKVGRGFKWMPKDEGFRRDVEVVRAIRKHVGPDVKLMVDANNGFDLASTKRWLDEVGAENLLFVEEMFPEKVDEDRVLREYIHAKGWATLVADGESAGDITHFEPYLKARVIDVLQPDIRALGLSQQMAMSRMMARMSPDARLAPHNWGSYLGFYMQLVLARGIGNFLTAECDSSASDLFDASAFEMRDGRVRVPDAPGCGLTLREDVFRSKYQSRAWTVNA